MNDKKFLWSWWAYQAGGPGAAAPSAQSAPDASEEA